MRSFRIRVAAVIAAVVLIAVVVAVAVSGKGGSTGSVDGHGQRIAMRVLLITDSTDPASASGISYGDWENTLKLEDVPFDTVVTSDARPGSVALPTLSSSLPNGNQVAAYQGVVLATSGREGLSSAQWVELQSFEHKFAVRQLTAYAEPGSDYGMSAPPSAAGSLPAGALGLTAHGAAALASLKPAAVDTPTWGYEARPLTGANVNTLILGPAGGSMLAVYTSSDGRQTMFQTFNETRSRLQSELSARELSWLTRGTYLGSPIGTVLSKEAVWTAASRSQIAGYISGNAVTVKNSGASTEMPLSGTTLGSQGAGGRSAWVSARPGTSTYTALAAWPAPPAGPVAVEVPAGPAPATPPAPTPTPKQASETIPPGETPLPVPPSGISTAITAPGNVCIQIPPAIVPLQQGMKANVYLRCKAGVQGTFCTGTLTLTIDGQSVAADYRIVTRQSAALTVRLPQRARAAAQSHASTALHATLKISTKQSDGLDKVLTGALTIEPAG